VGNQQQERQVDDGMVTDAQRDTSCHSQQSSACQSSQYSTRPLHWGVTKGVTISEPGQPTPTGNRRCARMRRW